MRDDKMIILNENQIIRETVTNALNSVSSASFCYLEYKNASNEVSRYKLLLNTNFMSMYKSDLVTLTNLETKSEIEETAKNELIESVKKSIETEFQHDQNPTKNMTSITKSIKFHEEKDELYIHAVSLEKKVIVPGVYKTVNSSEKTIAKNKIKKQLKQSNIRFFKLNLQSLKRISANGTKLVIKAE